MSDEVYGYAAELQHLSLKWKANEAELQRLADIPSGVIDPAKRERELDQEQDEIEYRIGELKRIIGNATHEGNA